MARQNYSNHIRFYPPHHFVLLPLAGILTGVSASFIFVYRERWLEWLGLTLAFLLVTSTLFMLRQHYALGNQNRIVRLELRLRYYQLTGQRLEPLEQRLSFGQLAALRFAPDEELPALMDRALQENLAPTEIKKAIKNWLPDEMRL